MRELKLIALRGLDLIEPCSLVENAHEGIEADDQCILCGGRGWVPTRPMIQAMFQAMSRDVQEIIHPYDLWAASEQIADMSLGDWVDHES